MTSPSINLPELDEDEIWIEEAELALDLEEERKEREALLKDVKFGFEALIFFLGGFCLKLVVAKYLKSVSV